MGGIVIFFTVVPGLLAILLATLVLYGTRDSASRSFAYFAYSMAAWAFGLAGYITVSSLEYQNMYSVLYYAAAMMLIHGFLLFSYAFRNVVHSMKLTVLATTIPVLVMVYMVMTGGVIARDALLDRYDVSVVYPGYALYAICFIAYAAIAFYNLFAIYWREEAVRKRYQLRIIIVTIAVTLLLASTFNLFLPMLGVYSLIMVGPVFIVPVVVIIFRLITKHGLFDIRLAAVRTLAYSLSIAVMAGIYFGLAYVASITLFRGASTTGVSMSPVNVVLALVLAFIFQPIKLFFDRVTNRIFYRDRYDTDDFISRLGDVLTSTTQLRQLLKNASNEIANTIKATFVSFVVYREDEGSDVVTNLPKVNLMTASEYDHIQQLVNDVDQPLLVIDELLQDGAKRRGGHSKTLIWLQKRRVSLILSLGKLGYVLLGEQKGSGYTSRDKKTLETISDELIIAIQNARSVQEIREINTHLEQRVETATKELRRTNDKLRKIDETKDEFVSMASHQLRTPLTSIKGYISMLLDGDAGEMTEQQKKLLKEAFSSSERMVRLIGDFLNVSRLQTGKFIIERKPTNLAELVQGEVGAITSLATTRSIQLSYKGPKQFPTMQLDEEKIQQVVMNFIDNAIYYSRPKSTIAVHLRKNEKFAIFEVHDHGIGVPKEALEKLFTKFFRAENARRQRPDGTGVGLYLAKRVIQGHGGELIMESTEGKGSVFGFRLPLS